tara:strand:- start:1632 stop:2747 length:1116 start_codon:yes stop_codon:yes gene_type:complete
VKNKKKILYFVSEDWYFVSHRIDLAIEAIQRGYEVTLLSNINEKKDLIESKGINTIHLPIERSKKNFLHDLVLFLQVLKIFKKEKPSILHCVSLKPILIGTLCARFLNNTKIINTFAGLGVLVKYKNSFFLKALIKSVLKFFLKSNSVKIIVQNQSDKNYFLSNNIVKKENLFLILGSGVDMNKFTPNLKNTKKIRVILVSRMLWSKGIREFVDLANKFINNRFVSFILMGKIDEKNPDSIPKDYLEALNLKSNIKWRDHTENVVEELNKSDIFCLPTSYGEGIPKALIEAAACGLPLVVSSNPGCIEVTENKLNGFVIDQKNSIGFYNSLKQLIESKKLRTKFGEFSRKKVKHKFSIENINKQTLNLYDL